MDEHLPQDLSNLQDDINVAEKWYVNDLYKDANSKSLINIGQALLAVAVRLDRIANVVEDRGYAHLDGEGGDSLARLVEMLP